MSFHSHYWLQPKAGKDFLPLSDLLARIRAAFPGSRIDSEKGRKDTELRLAALTKFGAPEELLNSYRKPGVYCYLRNAEEPRHEIECMIWPEQPIGVTFATEEHERMTFPLLKRLAEALEYDFALDPDAS